MKEILNVKGFQYFHTLNKHKCKLLFLQNSRVYGQLFAYVNSSFPSPTLFLRSVCKNDNDGCASLHLQIEKCQRFCDSRCTFKWERERESEGNTRRERK